MRWIALCSVIALAGCVATTENPGGEPPPAKSAKPVIKSATSGQIASFKQVAARVEPVAERQCRLQAPRLNCDFRIVLDGKRQPPNAFQSLDKSGRPVLTFTHSLIAEMRNQHEYAFVIGHEAAHHIEGHIPQTQQNAIAGAIVLGGLAAIAGAGSGAIDAAANLGANVGARSYSKNFELEADSLGTVITRRAGYNPVTGVAYFSRSSDPGNQFLGTHPPNAQRIETVRRVNASL